MANNIVSRITSAGTYFANGKFDEVSYNPTSGGTIAYSATPDKRTNILKYSQDFTNTSYWNVNGGSVSPNSIISPNGIQDASTIVGGSGFNGVWQGITATAGNTYTYSVYLKYISGANECIIGPGTPADESLYVNIQNGTIAVASPNVISYGVTSAGNGWYRFYGTTNSLSGFADIDIYQSWRTSTAMQFGVWGAQVETGVSATPYIVTDGIGSISRSNTQLHRYTTDWNKSFWNTNQINSNNTVTLTSATTAPDGSLTAYKFVANTGVDPNLGNSGLLVQQNGYGQITQGLVYTQSLFFKPAEFNTLRIRNNSDGAIYDFVAGTTPTATSGVLRPQLQNVGNGWYRASWSFVAQSIGGGGGRSDNWSYRLANTGDGTSGIYIWGPQLQVGNTLSPFIATSTPNTAINLFNTRTDNLGDVLTINDFDEVTYKKTSNNKNLFGGTESLTNYKPIDIYNGYPWVTSTATVVSTSDLDPNGNFTATKVSYGNQFTQIQTPSTGVPVASNTIYTISVSVKSTQQLFSIVTGNNAPYPTGSSQWAYYDLINNSAQYPGAAGSELPTATTIRPENNGFKRCTFSVKTDATQNQMYVGFWMGGYGLATTGNNMTLFGPQVEVGNVATPYQANTITLSSKTLNGGTIAVTNEIDEVTWNPPIVTANLTLHLDAANPDSYNGGNTWYDTSGKGNHGTLNGNVAVSSSNYGSMTFDGTTSPTETCIKFNTATGNSVGMYQSDFTVEAWVNGANTGAATPSGFPNYQIFDLLGSTPTAGSNYGMGYMQGYLVCGFYASGHYAFQPSPNTWYQIVHTFNYTTKSSKIYSNGILKDTVTMGTDLNANAAVAPVAVGWGYWGGGPWQGSIPVVRVYNKELSQLEINQNYKALAYRYNL